MLWVFCSLQATPNQNQLAIMPSLIETLEARFTDWDEIKDVARYGCIGGVSGFIYSSELHEFYEEHEEEIEHTLEILDIKLHDLVDTSEFYSMQELKEKAVWVVVEDFCTNRLMEAEAEHNYFMEETMKESVMASV